MSATFFQGAKSSSSYVDEEREFISLNQISSQQAGVSEAHSSESGVQQVNGYATIRHTGERSKTFSGH